MKVLFVVNHPVDPQIVISTAKEIENTKGKVLFVIIEKEGLVRKIVNSYGFQYIIIGKTKNSILSRIASAFKVVTRLIFVIKRFKPDIVFSPSSPYVSLACAFHNNPLVCWADTETAIVNLKLSNWRINSLLLPQSFSGKIKSKNVIRFHGYKELGYLHPNVFEPNEDVLIELKLSKRDKIVLMRFSALNATHDIGLKSEAELNDNKILKFIKKIEAKYNVRVYISTTERNMDDRFNRYKLNISPEKYIHLLSFCSLYFGEGTTTASEAGVLGIPWVNLQRTTRGYLVDQENNYNLGIQTDNINRAFDLAEEYLSNNNIQSDWKIKRARLIEDKIDVSAFILWFITNYPTSHNIMLENSDFQYKFK